ncbi:uncharacterized protein LOC127802519 [Diospyros lotus]|uniref:uncharacterized protein LOC127802519 n=1 Tax=Diospyros lotus TaxID=55363 RepID=UPI00225095F0|nr:uncharacterized protein LOC127802519 [Diospyros lotus]
MEEVIVASPAVDFSFFFFSVPTSPSRSSSYSCGGDSILSGGEQKPVVTAKDGNGTGDDNNNDFEFDFSGQVERTSLSADELFDGGKIKPLKPPPCFQPDGKAVKDPPKSPRSPVIENVARESQRQRVTRLRTSSSSRVGDIFSNTESSQQYCSRSSPPAKSRHSPSSSFSSPSSSPFSSSSWKGSKTKWSLKDLLLFRASSKDPWKKYYMLKKSTGGEEEQAKKVRLGSPESGGAPAGKWRRRRTASAHELHYTVNRAASEEMKRKTFLPYKRSLFGCLGFNPTVHDISSRGLGSLPRG